MHIILGLTVVPCGSRIVTAIQERTIYTAEGMVRMATVSERLKGLRDSIGVSLAKLAEMTGRILHQ